MDASNVIKLSTHYLLYITKTNAEPKNVKSVEIIE